MLFGPAKSLLVLQPPVRKKLRLSPDVKGDREEAGEGTGEDSEKPIKTSDEKVVERDKKEVQERDLEETIQEVSCTVSGNTMKRGEAEVDDSGGNSAFEGLEFCSVQCTGISTSLGSTLDTKYARSGGIWA